MVKGSTELGIDEAGRGPVLGPMVMAGVVVPENKKQLLIDWQVNDSKSFGSGKWGKKARENLFLKIIDQFEYRIITLSARTIDQFVEESNLNRLEQVTAEKLIRELLADRVILDGVNLFGPIAGGNRFAVNKADSIYLSVAAASILAKAERDRIFEELCVPCQDEYGRIEGGGYANGKTLQFVEWYLEKKGTLPPFYRRSYRWKALENLQLPKS